jgi:hypothetical protein
MDRDVKRQEKDWAALPERSVEEVKRIQRVKAGPSAPRGRGAAPLGPFTKKQAQAMFEAGKKVRGR